MITFDRIMETVEREKIGTVVRNCLPISVAEAEEAAAKHPNVKLEIFKDKEYGTCIVIKPRHFKSTGAQAVHLKGHEAVASFFRRRK